MLVIFFFKRYIDILDKKNNGLSVIYSPKILIFFYLKNLKYNKKIYNFFNQFLKLMKFKFNLIFQNQFGNNKIRLRIIYI